MGRAGVLVGAIALAALAACGPPKPPPPSVQEAMVAEGKAAVIASLVDPESARFGPTKAIEEAKLVCGTVNAKNRMGGYAGATPFFADLRNGQVHIADSQCSASCFMENWVSARVTDPQEDACAIPLASLEERCGRLNKVAVACGTSSEPAPELPESVQPNAFRYCLEHVRSARASCK